MSDVFQRFRGHPGPDLAGGGLGPLRSINSRGPTGDITTRHQPEAPLGGNEARAV